MAVIEVEPKKTKITELDVTGYRINTEEARKNSINIFVKQLGDRNAYVEKIITDIADLLQINVDVDIENPGTDNEVVKLKPPLAKGLLKQVASLVVADPDKLAADTFFAVNADGKFILKPKSEVATDTVAGLGDAIKERVDTAVSEAVPEAIADKDIPSLVNNAVVAQDIPGKVKAEADKIPQQVNDAVARADIPGRVKLETDKIPGLVKTETDKIPGLVKVETDKIPGIIKTETDKIPQQVMDAVDREDIPGMIKKETDKIPGLVNTEITNLDVPGMIRKETDKIPGLVDNAIAREDISGKVKAETDKIPGLVNGEINTQLNSDTFQNAVSNKLIGSRTFKNNLAGEIKDDVATAVLNDDGFQDSVVRDLSGDRSFKTTLAREMVDDVSKEVLDDDDFLERTSKKTSEELTNNRRFTDSIAEKTRVKIADDLEADTNFNNAIAKASSEILARDTQFKGNLAEELSPEVSDKLKGDSTFIEDVATETKNKIIDDRNFTGDLGEKVSDELVKDRNFHEEVSKSSLPTIKRDLTNDTDFQKDVATEVSQELENDINFQRNIATTTSEELQDDRTFLSNVQKNLKNDRVFVSEMASATGANLADNRTFCDDLARKTSQKLVTDRTFQGNLATSIVGLSDFQNRTTQAILPELTNRLPLLLVDDLRVRIKSDIQTEVDVVVDRKLSLSVQREVNNLLPGLVDRQVQKTLDDSLSQAVERALDAILDSKLKAVEDNIFNRLFSRMKVELPPEIQPGIQSQIRTELRTVLAGDLTPTITATVKNDVIGIVREEINNHVEAGHPKTIEKINTIDSDVTALQTKVATLENDLGDFDSRIQKLETSGGNGGTDGGTSTGAIAKLESSVRSISRYLVGKNEFEQPTVFQSSGTNITETVDTQLQSLCFLLTGKRQVGVLAFASTPGGTNTGDDLPKYSQGIPIAEKFPKTLQLASDNASFLVKVGGYKFEKGILPRILNEMGLSGVIDPSTATAGSDGLVDIREAVFKDIKPIAPLLLKWKNSGVGSGSNGNGNGSSSGVPLNFAVLSEVGGDAFRLGSSTTVEGISLGAIGKWHPRTFTNVEQSASKILNDASGVSNVKINPGKYLLMGYTSTLGVAASQARIRFTDGTDNKVITGILIAGGGGNLSFSGIVNIEKTMDIKLEVVMSGSVDDSGRAGGQEAIKYNFLGRREHFDSKPEFSKLVLLKIG